MRTKLFNQNNNLSTRYDYDYNYIQSLKGHHQLWETTPRLFPFDHHVYLGFWKFGGFICISTFVYHLCQAFFSVIVFVTIFTLYRVCSLKELMQKHHRPSGL